MGTATRKSNPYADTVTQEDVQLCIDVARFLGKEMAANTLGRIFDKILTWSDLDRGPAAYFYGTLDEYQSLTGEGRIIATMEEWMAEAEAGTRPWPQLLGVEALKQLAQRYLEVAPNEILEGGEIPRIVSSALELARRAESGHCLK